MIKQQRFSLSRSVTAALSAALLICNVVVGPTARAAADGQASRFSLKSSPATESVHAKVGKSILFELPEPIERISVGNPAVVDITLVNAKELYLLGKAFGNTNVILWTRSGRTEVMDVAVELDVSGLQAHFRALWPKETGIQVGTAAGSIVLSGYVSDAPMVDYALTLAEAYVRDLNRTLIFNTVAGDTKVDQGTAVNVSMSSSAIGTAQSVATVGARVVNLLKVLNPQQVMLEVKVAEVSRSYLEKIGVELNTSVQANGYTYSLIANLFDLTAGGVIGVASPSGNKFFNVHAEKDDGLVKILAEPNIIAVSGQEGSFLAGGKVLVPVERSSTSGVGTQVTLEEKEFGIGLKFTPTVLENGRINLRVTPEVSELQDRGTPFTTVGGVTAIFPAFSTRRASTTVQLGDGQSLAIAGLIKSNAVEIIKRIPVLGEIPVLGALFRSTEFQKEKTELVFVVTPRLVKPLPADHPLPTDAYREPTRQEFHLEGRLEGKGSAPGAAPAGTRPATRQFEVK